MTRYRRRRGFLVGFLYFLVLIVVTLFVTAARIIVALVHYHARKAAIKHTNRR